MKKYLLFSLLITNLSYAAVTSWKEMDIPYNYVLSNDLINRKCGYVPKIMKEIKEKNNLTNLDKIRIGDKLILPVCNNNEELYISSSEKSPLPESLKKQVNSANIVSWERHKVLKGYILSKDLAYQRNCSVIWTKQIAEFQKKNPNVKNINNIFPNKEIWVQNCKDEEATKELSQIVKENPELKEELTYLIGTDFRFDAYLGVSYLEKLGHLAGIGIRGNVLDAAGYELKFFNFGSNMLLLAEFEYKNEENLKMQSNLTLGIMNYMLNESGNKNSSSSAYITYGYIFRSSPITVFEIEAGLNLSTNIGFIASATGMKKVSKSIWAGLFMETRSLSTSQVKTPNNLILSGLKLSF